MTWPLKSSILDYVRDTAKDGGIDKKVRFGHRVVKASWSSEEARWTVTAEHADGGETKISCAFLMMCSGYYRYDQGYTPEFEGIEDFDTEKRNKREYSHNESSKKTIIN